MKLKLDDKGQVVTKDVSGQLMPIYIHDDGKELEFDAAHTVATISRLNAEAKTHREKAEELGGKLKSFAGIDDPLKALAALDTISKLDHKKLVDAGEVDKVRAEIAKVYDSQLGDMQKQLDKLTDNLYEEKVGGAFTRSKVIAEKFAVPADLIQARFGQHFGVENGNIYAADSKGEKLYSRTRPGELATFDEALMILVDQYPYKDSLLKGTGSSGSGARSSGSDGAGGKRTVTRAQFDQMDVAERAAAAKDYAIVD